MIKGKSPYPFQTIALAVSFSPGLPFLIAEMKRLSELHGSFAIFLHIGKKTNDKHRDLISLLSSHHFNDSNSRIYWEQGDTVPNILRICKHEVVDLLLLGASEKDQFKLPAGRITNEIATQAKCSVMIYADYTSVDKFKNIVIEGGEHSKTEQTIQTGIYFADKIHATNITVFDEGGVSSYADSYSGFSKKVEDEGEAVVADTPSKSKISINRITLSSASSNDIADYCFKNDTDLLVMRSSEHRLRIFDRISEEKSIENFLSKLPCNLLIVHSRPLD